MGVSLLMDVSSEMIHSLLPLFMATTLGVSVIVIGLIEGLAEATALIVKVFSGVLSDYLGKRKGLALLGYGLGAISKPFFAVASSSGMVMGARLLDRVGKGIRGAPRDALVADVTPPEIRGAAFGLRQSLDTVGAFLGATAGRRPDAAVAQRFSRHLLGGGDPGGAGDRAAVLRPERAGRRDNRQANPPDYSRQSAAAGAWLLVGSGHRRRLHVGALQRGVSGAESAAGAARRWR